MGPFRIFIFSIMVFSSFSSWGQGQNVQGSSSYFSALDSQLTIRQISVLPVFDNSNGIYSKPVEEELSRLISSNNRFQLIKSNYAGALVSYEDLESNPQHVIDLSKDLQTDAVIASKVTKQPDYILIEIGLFLKSDGLLVAKATSKEPLTLDIPSLKKTINSLFEDLVKNIPYDGIVLSRNSSGFVTLNIGKRNGLTQGQTLMAILLVDIKRHPKFNFILNSKKEVLGMIQLTKVEENLSFGQITSEKSTGAIQKGTKVSGASEKKYDTSFLNLPTSDKAPQEPSSSREWRPSDPPTFGKLGARMELGQVRYNTQLKSGNSSSSNATLFPSLTLDGELWITQTWYANFEMRQGFASINNSLSGSSPKNLSTNISDYYLSFGYYFLVTQDFFGPKFKLGLGYANLSLKVDPSTPLAFSSTKYQGFYLNLAGTTPISEDKKWNLGGELRYLLNPRLRESPQDSGSSKNNITRFIFFGYYQINTRFRYVGALDISLYSSTLSASGSRPDPASDLSQKYTLLSGGVEYLF